MPVKKLKEFLDAQKGDPQKGNDYDPLYIRLAI